MGKKVLVVVDMQKDFVDGALGTKEAVAIVPNVVDKIKNFDGKVIATRDTHRQDYLETQEGKNLPVVHCVAGTDGWEIDKRVVEALESLSYRYEVYNKPTFGSIELAKELAHLYEIGEIESVEFIGLCTGICVMSNAITLKAFCPEIPISVDAKCCACVTPESHKTALDAMKLCQINIVE